MSGTVLFIGGWGRSGSTILDRILGQIPGVFSAGELREIWVRGLLENRPCGCGSPFLECHVWREIGDTAFDGWGSVGASQLARDRRRLDRPWMVPVLALPRPRGGMRRAIDRYVSALADLYQAILHVTGARVVVDSSKLPSHAFLLRRVPGLDLRVLHLIRDSRGVAFSWQKRSSRAAPGEPASTLPRFGPLAASIRWLVYNAETSALARVGVPYRRLRYEDLMRAPREVVTTILRWVGLGITEDDIPFVSEAAVTLQPGHTVDGNPVRFATGLVPLRADDEWRRSLPSVDRAIVTTLTLPGLLRYGYRPFRARTCHEPHT